MVSIADLHSIKENSSASRIEDFRIKSTHKKTLMNYPTLLKNRHRNDRKGFSLVELMVVIAIIVILVFLSFVGISRARASARSAVCTSNLRQIGSAMIAYTIDNNGQLPPLEDRTGPDNGLRGIWPDLLAETNVNGVPNPRGGIGS